MKNKSTILFLGKKDDDYCQQALNFLCANFINVTCQTSGIWNEDIEWWKGDYIISYLSQFIVPDYLLKKANKAAINFHPGSPEYPGIGCVNFALYDNAKQFGATCHHMAEKVDTGQIIETKHFHVFETDNVESLLQRTYHYLLVLFYDVVGDIINTGNLSSARTNWTRKPYTRAELNSLSILHPTMTKQEIENRIRATTYRNWKPYFEVAGREWTVK